MPDDKKPAASSAAPPDIEGIKSASEMSEKELAAAGLRGAGTVTNRDDGAGTRQTEPRPEDYPAAGRILPPLEQVNPRMAQAVGQLAGREPIDDAIREGAEKHAANQEKVADTAQEITDLRRELEDKLA